jgi:hypothetical protein
MISTPATQRTAVCCTTVALLVVLFGVAGAINVVLAITSAVWWPWLVAAACTTAIIATLAATRAHGHSAPPQDPRREHRESPALLDAAASGRYRPDSQTTIILAYGPPPARALPGP